jgi:choline dehydrogenase
MGNDGDTSAVVGANLKAKGLHGLRVVDASIIPLIIGGPSIAVSMMIAEKASDMIKAD